MCINIESVTLKREYDRIMTEVHFLIQIPLQEEMFLVLTIYFWLITCKRSFYNVKNVNNQKIIMCNGSTTQVHNLST